MIDTSKSPDAWRSLLPHLKLVEPDTLDYYTTAANIIRSIKAHLHPSPMQGILLFAEHDNRSLLEIETLILSTTEIKNRKFKHHLARIFREVLSYSQSKRYAKISQHLYEGVTREFVRPSVDLHIQAEEERRTPPSMRRGITGPVKVNQELLSWLTDSVMPIDLLFFFYQELVMSRVNAKHEFLKFLCHPSILVLGVKSSSSKRVIVCHESEFFENRDKFSEFVVLNTKDSDEFLMIHEQPFSSTYEKYITALSNVTLFGKCGSKVTRIDKLYSTRHFFPEQRNGSTPQVNLAFLEQQKIAVSNAVGNYKEVLAEGLPAIRAMGDSISLADILHDAAKNGRQIRESEDRIDQYLKESLEVSRRIGYKEGEAKALNSLGVSAKNRGDYPLAIQMYTDSLHLMEEIGNGEGVSKSLVNLGIVAQEAKEFDKAAHFYTSAIRLKDELGLPISDSIYLRLRTINPFLDEIQKGMSVPPRRKNHPNSSSTFVLRGDAGSGKSIAMLQFAHHYIRSIEEELDNCSWNHNEIVIPIFLKSRQLVINWDQKIKRDGTLYFDIPQALNSNYITESILRSTPNIGDHLSSSALTGFFDFLNNSGEFLNIRYVIFGDAVDEIPDENHRDIFCEWVDALRSETHCDIYLAVRPGFPEVEQLATNDQIVDLEIPVDVLKNEMPNMLCRAWGISEELADVYQERFEEFEELLTHPLYVGWFCFLLYSNELTDNIVGTATEKKHAVIQRIVEIGIDSALDRRESPLANLGPVKRMEFHKKVRLFIALAHHSPNEPSMKTYFDKLEKLTDYSFTEDERHAIQHDCGILFLADNGLVWTHHTVPEIIYADHIHELWNGNLNSSLMADKPRISTPFIQRLSSLRGSTKLEIARELLEFPSITKSDADVLFSIADRFDWSRNELYLDEHGVSDVPLLDVRPNKDVIKDALNKIFFVNQFGISSEKVPEDLSVFWQYRVDCAMLLAELLNLGFRSPLDEICMTNEAIYALANLSETLDYSDVFDTISWYHGITTDEEDVQEPWEDFVPWNAELLLKRVKKNPLLIHDFDSLIHLVGVQLDHGGRSVDNVRPLFNLHHVELADSLLTGSENDYCWSAWGMRSPSASEYNLTMHFLSEGHQQEYDTQKHYLHNNQIFVSRSSPAQNLDSRENVERIFDGLRRSIVEIVFGNLYGKNWENKVEELYGLVKDQSESINKLYEEMFCVAYDDFFFYYNDNPPDVIWIGHEFYETSIEKKGISLIPFVAYAIGNVEGDIRNQFYEDSHDVAIEFVLDAGKSAVNRFRYPSTRK